MHLFAPVVFANLRRWAAMRKGVAGHGAVAVYTCYSIAGILRANTGHFKTFLKISFMPDKMVDKFNKYEIYFCFVKGYTI